MDVDEVDDSYVESTLLDSSSSFELANQLLTSCPQMQKLVNENVAKIGRSSGSNSSNAIVKSLHSSISTFLEIEIRLTSLHYTTPSFSHFWSRQPLSDTVIDDTAVPYTELAPPYDLLVPPSWNFVNAPASQFTSQSSQNREEAKYSIKSIGASQIHGILNAFRGEVLAYIPWYTDTYLTMKNVMPARNDLSNNGTSSLTTTRATNNFTLPPKILLASAVAGNSDKLSAYGALATYLELENYEPSVTMDDASEFQTWTLSCGAGTATTLPLVSSMDSRRLFRTEDDVTTGAKSLEQLQVQHQRESSLESFAWRTLCTKALQKTPIMRSKLGSRYARLCDLVVCVNTEKECSIVPSSFEPVRTGKNYFKSLHTKQKQVTIANSERRLGQRRGRRTAAESTTSATLPSSRNRPQQNSQLNSPHSSANSSTVLVDAQTHLIQGFVVQYRTSIIVGDVSSGRPLWRIDLSATWRNSPRRRHAIRNAEIWMQRNVFSPVESSATQSSSLASDEMNDDFASPLIEPSVEIEIECLDPVWHIMFEPTGSNTFSSFVPSLAQEDEVNQAQKQVDVPMSQDVTGAAFTNRVNQLWQDMMGTVLRTQHGIFKSTAANTESDTLVYRRKKYTQYMRTPESVYSMLSKD